jgi:hypothetical protein
VLTLKDMVFSVHFWWWTAHSAGPFGQMTRIGNCNGRASPLTGQATENAGFIL